MPTRDDKLTGQRPKPSRRSLIIATIVVSIILVVVSLVTAEVVMRLVRPAPPRGSLVLDDELGVGSHAQRRESDSLTAPTEPGTQPLRPFRCRRARLWPLYSSGLRCRFTVPNTTHLRNAIRAVTFDSGRPGDKARYSASKL